MIELLHRIARRPARRNAVIAVTAIAFALLVSLAATHLHITPDEDEACAVCVAFAGKIEGPSAFVPSVAASEVAHVIVATSGSGVIPPAVAVLLPPSCGPPQDA